MDVPDSRAGPAPEKPPVAISDPGVLKSLSSVPGHAMASIQDDDERLLARIGYKQVRNIFPVRFHQLLTSDQELRREFNKWSTVSYAISILGVLGSVPATFGVPIASGGPGTAVWAWFIGSVMAMCIASSGMLVTCYQSGLQLTSRVAELVSAYPTAGGMYFVTKHVVPKEHVAIWAWIIGWCNFLGQAGGVASLAYTIAQMILAAAVMNSSFEDGAYSFTPLV